MTTSPIALFTYNRPEHTRRTVEALCRNGLADKSDLLVFSDGPKSSDDAQRVESVRRYLRTLKGFKSVDIVCQSRNLGLANAIITGVTSVCQKYGRVIVVEDDLVTSPYFLRFMNEALNLYQDKPEVVSIHGYIYQLKRKLPETFFLRGADCWGWATWQRGWELFQPDGLRLLTELESKGLTKEFDFNGSVTFTKMLRQQIAGENDSWAIRWYASAFLRNKLTLYPGKSLVQNIGTDGSGRHAGATNRYQVTLATQPIRVMPLSLRENSQAREAIETFFKGSKAGSGRWLSLKAALAGRVPDRA